MAIKKANICAVIARRLDLCFGRVSRDRYDGTDAGFSRGQCHGLRMIAGRDRNHATLFFIIRQRKNLVGGAANLKRAGALQIFAFKEDLASGNSIKGSRGHDWRAVYAPGSFFDEFECQHWNQSVALPPGERKGFAFPSLLSSYF